MVILEIKDDHRTRMFTRDIKQGWKTRTNINKEVSQGISFKGINSGKIQNKDVLHG